MVEIVMERVIALNLIIELREKKINGKGIVIMKM